MECKLHSDVEADIWAHHPLLFLSFFLTTPLPLMVHPTGGWESSAVAHLVGVGELQWWQGWKRQTVEEAGSLGGESKHEDGRTCPRVEWLGFLAAQQGLGVPCVVASANGVTFPCPPP